MRNPLWCVPDAPLPHTAYFADVNAAMVSGCRAQTLNCGEAGPFDLRWRSDGMLVSFYCHVTSRYGTQGVTGIHSIALVEITDAKGAGPCCDASRPSQQHTTHPINLANGNKIQVEDDYVGAGAYPLRLTRYYNGRVPAGVGLPGSIFSEVWRHTYERSLLVLNTVPPRVTPARHTGAAYTFTLSGSAWQTDPDVSDRLLQLADLNGTLVGWQYISGDDEVETYDVNGRLLSIANRAGLAHALEYDAQGRVAAVRDSFGRALTFGYDAAGRVAMMIEPSGVSYAYTYDVASRLVSVTYPDSAVRTYHYPAFSTQWNTQLLGITDENNSRYSTYAYDPQNGYAISSELAGGVDRISVNYVYANTVVTDALGTVRTFSNNFVQGIRKNFGVDKPCPTCDALTYSYDANGYISVKVDFNNNRTNYTRDSRGLETRRVEGLTSSGATTPVTRTTTTEWDATYRLPTRIAEPNRITTIIYGSSTDPNPGNRGSLLTKTIQATTDANGSLGLSATPSGTPRTWSYTYNGNGQVLTIDGPRTDVSDVTTYSYYANDASCTGSSPIGCRGQIYTITNAAGHVTTISEYNAHGQPLTTIDPNGLVTTLGYDARMRLVSRNVGGELTSYTYDNAGQLTRVTLPDASSLAYTYDAAHRLTQILDHLGNRISYTLDLMGNRIAENVYDPADVLAQTRTRVYNSLNRLSQEIGAAGQTTTYGYDNQGNVTSIDGPLAGTVDVTTNAYDALNRLTRVTDPAAGQVNYGYNGRDQLVSVSDPRNLVTSYAYDGLDNLNQLVSPDTGTTVNTYDLAGNILTATDAKGQVTRYTYDALNRVTSITYHDGAVHTYQYDQGPNGLGRLTQVTEPNSTTQYAYDSKGRLTAETRTISTVAYTTAYGYDNAGRLTSVTYPSGRQITYALDSLGRIQTIATTKDGETKTLISNVAYRPFGAVQNFLFGNGHTYTRGYDADGRTASYTLANQSIAVGYDPASRIITLADTGNAANTNQYSYDRLDRVTSFVGPTSNQSFTYDAVGNRVSKLVGSASSTYTYSSTSNRLNQITGSNPRTYTYDPVGSVTADSFNTYTYDARGRMVQSLGALGPTDYKLNSFGQRIRKTNSQSDVVYHYDKQGRLIAESSATGATQREYVYLGDMLVAIIAP